MSLDGKVVIVTGAGGNLGSATLAVLSRQGARLVAAERRDEVLKRSLAATDHPTRHLAVAGINLAEEGDCATLVGRAMERFGRVDGLATTVGGFAAAPLASTDAELLLQMMCINTVTTLNIMRAVLAPMRAAGTGSVVVVGAASARQASAGIAAYAAAKSAALRMVESFADEVRPEGVRVNAVLPGTIDTPQNRAAMPGVDHATWVSPDQVAEVIAFLLSDAATSVTGALIPVTGRG
jgi:NAD(P)-dependent dehydrogenase (short-subunit alcohol dehydrogenase family)